MGWFCEENKSCSMCTYLDPSDMDSNKMYWCEKRLMRVSPCAAACDRYTKAYSRSDEQSKSLRENASNTSSGCFITTIVCNILGYADKSSYLQTLRYFRDNVLQKNKKYKYILACYDVIGPEISKCIENDKNRFQISLDLFDIYITKVCKLIELKKDEEAIKLYMDMTNLLINTYGIVKTYDEQYLNNMDVKNSGHGKVAILK